MRFSESSFLRMTRVESVVPTLSQPKGKDGAPKFDGRCLVPYLRVAR